MRKQVKFSDDDGFITRLLEIWHKHELGKSNREFILRALITELKKKRLTKDQMDYLSMIQAKVMRTKDFQQSALEWQPINYMKRLIGMVAGGHDDKAILEKRHFFLSQLELNRHNKKITQQIKKLNKKTIATLRQRIQYGRANGYSNKQLTQFKLEDLMDLHPKGIDPSKTIEFKSVRKQK